jgi:hypothetical protein
VVKALTIFLHVRLKKNMEATNDENLEAHASCVLPLDDKTSRLEACAPRVFSEESLIRRGGPRRVKAWVRTLPACSCARAKARWKRAYPGIFLGG